MITIKEIRSEHHAEYTAFVQTATIALMAEQGEENGYYGPTYRDPYTKEETSKAFTAKTYTDHGTPLEKVPHELLRSREQTIAKAACDLADALLQEWIQRI